LGKIVGQGFVRLNGPGKPPTTHQNGLQLSVAYAGRLAATSDPVRESLPPTAPRLTGYAYGGSVAPLTVRAQHTAWLWPRPPAGPIQLTLQWNALDVAPVTITLDGIAPAD
jgi:hypothetical protein